MFINNNNNNDNNNNNNNIDDNNNNNNKSFSNSISVQVQFRPVFWGLAIQFYFALLILRTQWGYDAFQWLGSRIKEFLEHTDAGVNFVFGGAPVTQFNEGEFNASALTAKAFPNIPHNALIHFFAFKVFISFTCTLLYDLDSHLILNGRTVFIDGI